MSARRFSGDVEIRIEPRVYKREVWYVASIAAPYHRSRAVLSLREAGLGKSDDPRDSESYDKAASAFLKLAQDHGANLPVEMEGRKILVRRVFRSPCHVAERKS